MIDRVPDELWNEVRDIVQETGIKTIPMKKKCKKAKWLSGEALQIAVKRREAKSKGIKERYKHLNAEFQRITRRDKKAFLGDQYKEIEEKNRMGKTRDLFMEKAMAPHSSTLAWKIPWTEEPGRLQSMGSHRSDTTERLHFHFSLSYIEEGSGNPLRCSCLENPRDGGTWWAALYGVVQRRTQLKQLSRLLMPNA